MSEPSELPSAVISTAASVGLGEVTATSMGKRSPLKTCEGMVTDCTSRAGCGRPGSATVSMGTPSCCACQMARDTLPRFSLPSETSSRRGRYPAGSDASASRMAASMLVPLPAVPAVPVNFQPALPRSSGKARARAAREGKDRRPMPSASAFHACGERGSGLEVAGREAGGGVHQNTERHLRRVHGEARLGQREQHGEHGKRLNQERAAAAGAAPLPRRPGERQPCQQEHPGPIEGHARPPARNTARGQGPGAGGRGMVRRFAPCRRIAVSPCPRVAIMRVLPHGRAPPRRAAAPPRMAGCGPSVRG